MQNRASVCWIFLGKCFVLRRLQISCRYAPSSLLALPKNLLRNHFAWFCIVTAKAQRFPAFPAASSAELSRRLIRFFTNLVDRALEHAEHALLLLKRSGELLENGGFEFAADVVKFRFDFAPFATLLILG